MALQFGPDRPCLGFDGNGITGGKFNVFEKRRLGLHRTGVSPVFISSPTLAGKYRPRKWRGGWWAVVIS